jgi:hypothetical protein
MRNRVERRVLDAGAEAPADRQLAIDAQICRFFVQATRRAGQ